MDRFLNSQDKTGRKFLKVRLKRQGSPEDSRGKKTQEMLPQGARAVLATAQPNPGIWSPHSPQRNPAQQPGAPEGNGSPAALTNEQHRPQARPGHPQVVSNGPTELGPLSAHGAQWLTDHNAHAILAPFPQLPSNAALPTAGPSSCESPADLIPCPGGRGRRTCAPGSESPQLR